MYRLLLTIGLATFTTVTFLLYATSQWVQKEQRSELVALSERSAVAMDLQFEIWKTALSSFSDSHSMVRDFDIDVLQWEADQIARQLGGWAVLLTSDLSTQLFNTRQGAVAPFTSQKIPELSRAVKRSVETGRPVVTDVFTGPQVGKSVVAVVQLRLASTGDEYVTAMVFDTDLLSRTIQKATLHYGSFISVADGSARIVARSSQLEQFFMRPLPHWYLSAVNVDPQANIVVTRGEGIEGVEADTYLFVHNKLKAAPGWSLAIGKPSQRLLLASYLLLLPISGGIIMFLLVGTLEYFRLTALRGKQSLILAEEQSRREYQLRSDLEAALAAAREGEVIRRDMLGVLGHEMRTPVLSALAALQLVPTDLQALDTKKYLVLAEKGLKALQSLIQDILDMSLLNAGEFRLDLEPFNLPDLLSDAIDIMAPMADRHKLELRADWSQVPVHVIGDSKRIRQILINLLTNAVKYTREGNVTLRAHCKTGADGRIHIDLCIIDTGPGIPKDKITEVFKPFTRMHETTQKGISGLGLGLAITQRLAEAMNGTVTVESTVGNGSSFCLKISLELAPAQKDQSEVSTTESFGLAVNAAAILIVEDHPLQAALLARMLNDMSATTTLATTGQEALAAIKNSHFDVILIDLGLPDMTGIDLVQRLKDAGSIAVHVALSANPGSLSIEQQALFDRVESKTGEKNIIRTMIINALAGQGVFQAQAEKKVP